jgi:hypothetical protein
MVGNWKVQVAADHPPYAMIADRRHGRLFGTRHRLPRRTLPSASRAGVYHASNSILPTHHSNGALRDGPTALVPARRKPLIITGTLPDVGMQYTPRS